MDNKQSNSDGWQWTDYDQYVEVIPLNDTKEHFAGDECWCQPRRVEEENQRPVISHNSNDRREIWERLSTGNNTKEVL